MAHSQQQTLDSSIPASTPLGQVRQRVKSVSLYAQTMQRLQRSRRSGNGRVCH